MVDDFGDCLYMVGGWSVRSVNTYIRSVDACIRSVDGL